MIVKTRGTGIKPGRFLYIIALAVAMLWTGCGARPGKAKAHLESPVDPLEQALVIAQSNQNAPEDGMRLVKVIGALAAAGRYERAVELARSIENPATRAAALGYIAVTEMEHGQEERAAGLVEELSDPNYLAQALAGIAVAAEKSGKHEKACAMLDRAMDFYQEVKDEKTSADLASTLVQVTAFVGRYDDARVMVLDMVDPISRITGLMHVAMGYKAHGMQVKASELLGMALEEVDRRRSMMDENIIQYILLPMICSAYAKIGEFESAVEMAGLLVDDAATQTALTGIALAYAEAGDVDQALALLDPVKDPMTRAACLAEIAGSKAAADAGISLELLSKAMELASGGTAASQSAMDNLYARIAAAYVSIGEIATALDIAGKVKTPSARVDILIAAAGAGKAGSHDVAATQ